MSLVILWFRHGLRIHDNSSLHEALKRISEAKDKKLQLLPIFVFDGESAGTKICGFNRFKFLLECLQDLDKQFRDVGGRLYLARGNSVDIFGEIHKALGLDSVFFEQDCEPVWKIRDEGCKKWMNENGIHWVEKVGHTLWNPHEVIEANGGTSPITFSMFNHVISTLDQPERPLDNPDMTNLTFPVLDEKLIEGIRLIEEFPDPEFFGVAPEGEVAKVYKGGETIALSQLKVRLEREQKAFQAGSFLPNQREPDILCPPKSLSPDLRFGSLSVRKFYWGIIDSFKETQKASGKPFNPQIVVQLLWREFFYTMSVNNDYYNEMERNDICINIPWYPIENNEHWKAFEAGKTGFPFIDAGMRQLYKEGWIHHIVRNAIACFLTRGDLWISWEHGLTVFLKYLLDADWSVCAGNWMWISSSAFEQVLNCSTCIDPCVYGRRSDPWGKYIKKFIPELAKYPVEYIYEPWKAPIDVQKQAGCVVGQDYPNRIVNHIEVSNANATKMKELKESLLRQISQVPVHVAPSDEHETREFMAFPDSCCGHQGKNCCKSES